MRICWIICYCISNIPNILKWYRIILHREIFFDIVVCYIKLCSRQWRTLDMSEFNISNVFNKIIVYRQKYRHTNRKNYNTLYKLTTKIISYIWQTFPWKIEIFWIYKWTYFILSMWWCVNSTNEFLFELLFLNILRCVADVGCV